MSRPESISTLKTLRTLPNDGPIFDHPHLRRAISIARTQHETPGLQIWTGPSGVGKSVAAKQLAHECNEAAEAEKPGAYRAFYYWTGGEVTFSNARQMKRGIYSVYTHVIGTMTPSALRLADETLMAREVAMMLMAKEMQLVIIDEAGTKSVPELRGIAAIVDEAANIGHPLTILLVGMDDLAEKSQLLEVVKTRTRVVLTFDAWTASQCAQFVASRVPSLAALAVESPKAFGELVRPLIERSGGVLRELQTLLPEIEKLTRKGNDPSAVIATAQTWRDRELQKALNQSKANRARMKNALALS